MSSRDTRHRALSRSLDLHEELLDGLPVGVLGLSEDGRVVLHNRKLELLTGRTRADAIGKPFFETIAQGFDDAEIRDRVRRALPPESATSTLAWTLELPGRSQPLHTTLYFRPLSFSDRHIVSIVVEDITERTLLAQERDRLLAALFHDLRSPLSGIDSFTALFSSEDGWTEESMANAEHAVQAMHQIGTACRDMIELIDATTQQLRGANDAQELLDLAFLAHGVALESAMICGERNLELRMNGHPVEVRGFDPQRIVPVRVYASRTEAGRSLRNLLGNACKYAQARIELAVRDHGDGTVLVTVEDDGPGVPAGFETRIFAGGVQAPGAKPGTGLGLQTVQLWAEAMGGQVSVDGSKLGGARFQLLLPLA